MDGNSVIPKILVSRYRKLMDDGFQDYLKIMNSNPPLNIRVNTLKMDYQDAFTRMIEYGWNPTNVPWSQNSIQLGMPTDLVSKHLDSILGYYYFQGAASTLPPLILKPDHTSVVLDLCASPGSKTTQIAALMNNHGTIIANEPSNKRIRALRHNLQKMGVINAIVVRRDGRFLPSHLSECSHILVDAPCSSFGSIRKYPWLLNRYSKTFIEQYVPLQKGLVRSAYKCLQPGGRMVYSTCSIEPEENELVIDHLLRHSDAQLEKISKIDGLITHNGLTRWDGHSFKDSLVKSLRLFPQDNNTEGFYIALITRPITSESETPFNMNSQAGFTQSIVPFSQDEKQRTYDYLNRLYGWTSSSFRLMRSGKNRVWITSSDLKSPFRQSIPIETVGMYFGKYDMRLFRLSFDATILFRSYLKNHSIALNDEQKISWLEGKSVRAEYPASYERSFVILRWKDDVVGCGFPQSGEIRNFIPKNRRPLKKEK